jgi:hypothetical protein
MGLFCFDLLAGKAAAGRFSIVEVLWFHWVAARQIWAVLFCASSAHSITHFVVGSPGPPEGSLTGGKLAMALCTLYAIKVRVGQ